MKKQKTKKKLSKVQNKQLDVAQKFIEETKQEVLELTPQTPLGIEHQAEFNEAGFNKE